MKRIFDFRSKFKLILLIVFCYYPLIIKTDDECDYWHDTCEQFRTVRSQTKFCIGKTLFFFSDFLTDWESARSYCSGVFNGYRDADLLYYDEKSDPDPDLETLLENRYNKKNVEFPTTALCCPRLKILPNKTSHRYFDCKWLHNGQIISKQYYQNVTFRSDDHCYFLMVNFSPANETIRFTRSSNVKNPQVTQFMCTYKRPSKCLPPPTTSSEPSTRTTTIVTTPTSTTTLGPLVCEEKDEYGLHWPATIINETAHVKCPENYTGDASWLCGPDGQFVPSGPIINCKAKWIDDTSKKIDKVKNIDQLSHEVNRFQDQVKQQDTKFFQDLKGIVNVINKIESTFVSFASNSTANITLENVHNITASVVDSCATIVDRDQIWTQTHHEDRIMVAGKILNSVQDSGLTMGCLQAKSDTNELLKSISSKNIFVNSFDMDHEQPIHFGHLNYQFSLKNSLAIPDVVSEWCPYRLAVGALFKKLSSYMFDKKRVQHLKMNSEIIAFSYNNNSRKTFPLPADNLAIMKLVHHEKMKFGMHSKCVFWNFTSNIWSSSGCHVLIEQSNRSHTTCVCDHLTNFAVLMDVSGQEHPSKLKSILTIVMCTLSIICLILTIAFSLICRELKTRRTSIIINISTILIAIDLLVIFGLDRTEYPLLCKSVSVSLLYTMLALFFWMLMEGYNLYQMMIFIFNTKGHLKMVYLYLIGYGIPLLITIPATIYMSLKTELSNEYYCWITSTKYPGQIWFLAGPVTLIILINTFIMIRVMKIVLSKNSRNQFRNQSSFNPSTSSASGVVGGGGGKKFVSNGHFAQNIAQHQKAKKRTKQKYKNENTLNSKIEFESTESDDSRSIEEIISEWWTYFRGFLGLIVLMGITWISYVLYIHQYGHFFSYVFIVLNGLQGVFIFITQFIFNRKARDAIRKRLYRMIGFDDYNSATRNTTTTSYLSQQRASKASLSTNINQTNFSENKNKNNNKDEDDDIDDNNRILPSNKYNVLIDRTTSFEY